jgi:hypothetical protein
MERIKNAALVKSKLYSEELGINLSRNTDEELFKWFLASILFGARISEAIAEQTYLTFKTYGLLDPDKIQAAGWNFLVDPVMREGGYVRYDARTSTQILVDSETLQREYNGSLKKLHRAAADESDLEQRLEAFYGVGPVTANIFLRELRPYWSKSDPEPLPVVKEGAARLGIDLNRFDRKSIAFTRLEAGLIRGKHPVRRAA